MRAVLAGTANLVAGIVFLFVADVAWLAAGLIAAGSTAGGVIGAGIGRRLPDPVAAGDHRPRRPRGDRSAGALSVAPAAGSSPGRVERYGTAYDQAAEDGPLSRDADRHRCRARGAAGRRPPGRQGRRSRSAPRPGSRPRVLGHCRRSARAGRRGTPISAGSRARRRSCGHASPGGGRSAVVLEVVVSSSTSSVGRSPNARGGRGRSPPRRSRSPAGPRGR